MKKQATLPPTGIINFTKPLYHKASKSTTIELNQEMTQEVYYKATRANMVSGYDPNFTYHIGLNIHPNPDRKSNNPCGEGIHLARTILAAKNLCKGWKEIYEAKAGVVLGEDSEKIRVASCYILRRIDTNYGFAFPNRPSLNDKWLDKHAFDVTMEDILSQKLEIVGNKHFSLNLKMRKTDRRHILRECCKA